MSHGDYKKWPCRFYEMLCHPIDFKKVLCRPVEFMEVPCHPVDFKKVPCRMSLMPKKCCVAVSIFGVYTPSSVGPYVDNYCLTLTQSIPQSSNGRICRVYFFKLYQI